MSSEWFDKLLGDVVTLKRGYDLPAKERKAGGVPIISSSGFSDTHEESKVSGPGVVTGRYGTIGEVFYSEKAFWPLNTTLYVEDFKGNHPKFIYYLLKTIDYHRYSDKAAVPGVNRNHLHTARVHVPDLGTQISIARVLGAFDDRIDLLRQTNTTLEAIAQAIFKSWFVDFDPVKAKAEGLEPVGMDAATAELFPSEFDESELGLIPKGWHVGTLGDVLKQRTERTKPCNSTAEKPYVPIECITSKSIFLAEHLPGDQAQSSLTLFCEGDVLFGAMRPYFHKVCIAPFDGVTRTTAFVLKPAPGYSHFALMAAFDSSTVEFATNHSEGSTIPYAKWGGSLENKQIVVPPEAIARLYGSSVAPLIERGILNTQKIKTLSEIRDELLPRLISGKLRLTEVEEELEEALG